MKKILNLGILAHIDAGKTSLTERLLFNYGTITKLGSVDAGSTTTDTSDLERERGITIRAAVAPFILDDLQVNIIDTPGHPDFIAEVERSLSVLDAVILVVSATDGVQPQTRVLAKTLKKMQLPVILFINKIDQLSAYPDTLLGDIRRKISPYVLPMNCVECAGKSTAKVKSLSFREEQFYASALELLTEIDDELLFNVVDNNCPSFLHLEKLLIEKIHNGLLYPIFYGSAVYGLGIEELAQGVKKFFGDMQSANHNNQELEGIVFAIDHQTDSGEKTAYLRLYSGELIERQEVTFYQQSVDGSVEWKKVNGKITNLEIIGEHLADRKSDTGQSTSKNKLKRLTAGGIAKIKGFSEITIGASLRKSSDRSKTRCFSQPCLEAIIRPLKEKDKNLLYKALMILSDEDPLIQVRSLGNGEVSILLFGEVQKEVIKERLKREFSVEAVFSQTTPVYFERPHGVGEAEYMFDPHGENDFWATIGLRIEPNNFGNGNRFIREAQWGLMPAGFYRAIEESAIQALEHGLYGWKVTDCSVFLTKVDYERPLSVAADFRNLTPILLMRALLNGGTEVYEPCSSFEIEAPSETVGNIVGYLSNHEATILKYEDAGTDSSIIHGDLPTRSIQEVLMALPRLSQGEGVLHYYPGSDRIVYGKPPVRARTDGNPLNYEENMRFLSQKGVK